MFNYCMNDKFWWRSIYRHVANESLVSACRIVCAELCLNSDKRNALPFYGAECPAHRVLK